MIHTDNTVGMACWRKSAGSKVMDTVCLVAKRSNAQVPAAADHVESGGACQWYDGKQKSAPARGAWLGTGRYSGAWLRECGYK